MKQKLFGLIFVLFATSLFAMYAVLVGQESNGTYTNCYYNDGSVISVGIGQVCPVSKQ